MFFVFLIFFFCFQVTFLDTTQRHYPINSIVLSTITAESLHKQQQQFLLQKQQFQQQFDIRQHKQAATLPPQQPTDNLLEFVETVASVRKKSKSKAKSKSSDKQSGSKRRKRKSSNQQKRRKSGVI